MIFIEEPTECPCCSYKLQKVNDQLFCRNTACSAQINKKIEHFAKVLGIKGLGPKTVEKLNIAELTELFYLDPEDVVQAVGEKVAVKLLQEIEAAKSATLATVIESFSIPLVGSTASTKIANWVSEIDDITFEICKSAGLGDKVSSNLVNWVETEYQELKEFLPFRFKPVAKVNSSGLTVCITGKLKSFKKKADAAASLAAAGFTLVESVTKTTSFLVDEGNSTSSKRERAVQYGIPIITDLNDLLKV
jgi:DNA ligase (NAD+)